MSRVSFASVVALLFAVPLAVPSNAFAISTSVPVAPQNTPHQIAQVDVGGSGDYRQKQVVATSDGFVVASGTGNLRAYSRDGAPLWSRTGLISYSSTTWNGFAVTIEPELNGTRILVSWALKNYVTPAFLIDAATGATLWKSSNASFISNGAENAIEPNGNGNVFVASGPTNFAVQVGSYFRQISLSTGTVLSNLPAADWRMPQNHKIGGYTVYATRRAFLDKTTGFLVRVNDLEGRAGGPKAYLGITVLDASGKSAWSHVWAAQPYVGTWRGLTYDAGSASEAGISIDAGHLDVSWEPWMSDHGREHRQFYALNGHLRWKADLRAGLSGNDVFGTWIVYATGASRGMTSLWPTNDGKNHANDVGVVDQYGKVHRVTTGCKVLERIDRYGAPVIYQFVPGDVTSVKKNDTWYFVVALTCVTSGSISSTGHLTDVHQKDLLFVIDASHYKVVTKIVYNPSMYRNVFGNGYNFGDPPAQFGFQSPYSLTSGGILTAYSGSTSTYLRLFPIGSATATWTFRPVGWESADSATSFALSDGTIAVLTDTGPNTAPLQLTLYQ